MDLPLELTDDPYYHLAQTGPYAPVIGAALITMVEPHVGHEHGYNRWYEDDHYNAGAMAFPWMWAGRRYVAPVPYQQVRYPADSPVAMGMMFAPMPLPGDKQPDVKDVEGVDDRLTILWFTESDSLDAWDDFAGAGDLVEKTGLGQVELMAPFTPTFPGTDRYVDELRT